MVLDEAELNSGSLKAEFLLLPLLIYCGELVTATVVYIAKATFEYAFSSLPLQLLY